MSEEPPKPTNQEDIQALDELRDDAIANGTYAEQAKAFADQAESIGVDASQRYADTEVSESSGVIRPTTTGDVQSAIAEYNDNNSEMSEVGPAAIASMAQEPYTFGEKTKGDNSESNQPPEPAQSSEPSEQPELTQPQPDDDLYKEYSKAVRDESETFSVKDQETGEFVQKKAKDLNFREWLSATEKKKAAKWYTQTRPHGEAPDELDIDHPSEEDIQRTLDKDHQERLNAQEGKANPTEDDKAYYRWLKGNGGQEEPGTGNSPEEDDSTNGKEPWDKYSRNKKRPGDEDPRTVEIPVDEDPRIVDIIKTPELLDIEEQLESARSEYARMREGREGSTFFSFLYSEKKLEAAAQKYEELKAQAEAIAIDLLERYGLDERTLKSAVNFGRFVEESKLIIEQYGYGMQRIAKQRPQTRKFFEWWNKQSGKLLSKGNLKKTGVMAAIGLPIGLAVGTVASPFIGGGLAGAAGVASLRAISKGILGLRIKKGAGSADLVAEKAMTRIEHLQQITDRIEDHNEELTAESIDTLNRRLTDSAKQGNDREALKAMLIAGTAGAIGAWAIGSLFGDNPTAGPPSGPPKPNFSLDDFKHGIYRGVVQQGSDAQHSADIAIEQLNQIGAQPSASFNALATQVVNLGAHGTPSSTLEKMANFLGRSVNQVGGTTLQPEQLVSAGAVKIIKDGIEGGLSDDAIRSQIIEKLAGV